MATTNINTLNMSQQTFLSYDDLRGQGGLFSKSSF